MEKITEMYALSHLTKAKRLSETEEGFYDYLTDLVCDDWEVYSRPFRDKVHGILVNLNLWSK